MRLRLGRPRMVAHRVIESDAFAWVLVALGLGKLATTAIFVNLGTPAWMGEELLPLFQVIVDGRPIDEIGARQYGVVTLLIFDPVVRIFGRTAVALNLWSLVIGLACIALAFLLMARRFFPGRRRAVLFMAAFWTAFTPTAFIVEQRHVETFELLFLCVGIYWYTGTWLQTRLAAIPLALGMLTKLLPGAVLVFLTVRDPRRAWSGWVAALILLAIGQILYGSLMGFGYPVAMLARTGDATFSWSTQHENNSLRALLFKAGAGFRLADDANVIRTDAAPALHLIAYLLVTGLFTYLLFAGIRGRRYDSVDRRALELALAIVTMLIVSPGTAHDPMILTLPAFTILGYLRLRRLGAPWPRWVEILATFGAVLVGVFVPIKVLGLVIPISSLMTLAGNGGTTYFGSNLASYDLLGFPGVGLLLTWVALVGVERRWSRSHVSAPQAAARN